MIDLDAWQEIFSSLGRHKLRTLLTAFGVFWGIFLLVLLLGVGKGIENGVYSQFGRSAINRFAIWGRSTSLPYKGLRPGRPVRLTTEDVEAIRHNIPEARFINASVGLWGEYAIRYNNKSSAFSVRGEFPELLQVRHFEINQGRFLNASDVATTRKVAVLGRQAANVLFGEHNPVGEYLNIKGVFFLVVGVFDVAGFGSNQRQTEIIYLPLTTLLHTFNQGNHIWSMNIVVDNNIPIEAIETKTKALLKKRHRVAPNDGRAIGSWNASEEFEKFQRLFRGIRIFLWIIGTGTIIAGVIGVSNIMLIMVKERTREIGIRKALGATPFSIVSLIIQEAIFITTISGYTGLVVSVGVLEAVSSFMEKFGIRNEFFRKPEVDFPIAVAAVAIVVCAGAVAGWIPARNAAQIDTIEALRGE